MGQIARLAIDTDCADAGTPSTLIAKLPTTVDANRAAAEAAGVYEREHLFYENLAEKLSLRTPRLYHAAMDPGPDGETGTKTLKRIDRLPFWLLRVLLWLGENLSRPRRRFVLLIEDMAPARVGDQVAGAGPEACQAALRALARCQAEMWESPELQNRFWLPPYALVPRLMMAMYRREFRGFRGRFAGRATTQLVAVYDWLDRNAVALMVELEDLAPETLIHGDYRLDNLLFADTEETVPDGVAAIDWQGVMRGPGVYDAAYFLSGSLAADVPLETEQVLVRAYHDELVRNGVSGYNFDQLWSDYERAMVLVAQRIAIIDALDLGEGRGAEMLNSWVERIAARVAQIDLDKLLRKAAPGTRAALKA